MTSSGPDAVERERRRKAAELLGDLLPSTTSDETDEGWGERRSGEGGGPSRDSDFLRDVPPHHG